MAKFSRKSFFEQHGIQYSNIQWAWGGHNPDERFVALTVWTDRLTDGLYPVALPWLNSNGKLKLGYKDAIKLIDKVLGEGYRLRLMVSEVKQPWREGQTRTIEEVVAMPAAELVEKAPGEWWARVV